MFKESTNFEGFFGGVSRQELLAAEPRNDCI